MTGEPLVDVEGLAMSYGDRTVLRDVTFAVRRGEVLALLGPNGAGKSTTIEVLEGFRIRSGGRVRVLGVDPAHGGEDWRARIAILDDGRIVADGTPAQLAATIVGHDTVRWRCDGTSFEKSTPASTEFVHDLFSEHGRAITDLEVRRATLEDTYLALVRHAEDASLPEAS
ncbi:ABC-type multidrug transport system ATPase subunit [Nocardia sp. GAS34]|uniref:ATP-binding cassette domain-containing protein n=1 Tax=unclassified Nocardia TaxID=2637762 RepID=UPI003D202477